MTLGTSSDQALMDFTTAPSRSVTTSPTSSSVTTSMNPLIRQSCFGIVLLSILTTSSKHLDAHLRPYRCTREACRSIQFSSTACVLRHEREAHGMHGHGHKPYTCRFADCERANPENGFPRKWNLKDHMKRVHHFDEEAAQKSAASPMTPPESPSMHIPGPQRVKRSGRASPKPRLSKDDTIKAASSSRRAIRMTMPQTWDESLTQDPDMHQDIKYEQTWGASFPQQWTA